MIEVANGATLSIGNNTTITGNTTIISTQEISIGERCMISWENLIMDSDWHNIVDLNTGNVKSKQKPITIGNHVWIGCRCTILKGTSIPDDSIVASNSKISKVFTSKNVVIGSNNILREKVNWG
jgi:acetyltransferase-like isoleucine patch superfamily enzyme